ncbi:MAG TPA: hypothetical protein VFM01_01245 [Nakamurella sp.]|nr:hypothetical protein [Nakamurella sp.]
MDEVGTDDGSGERLVLVRKCCLRNHLNGRDLEGRYRTGLRQVFEANEHAGGQRSAYDPRVDPRFPVGATPAPSGVMGHRCASQPAAAMAFVDGARKLDGFGGER